MEALITLLVTLSVASERLTDIAKNKLTILNKPTDGSTPRLSDKQRTVITPNLISNLNYLKRIAAWGGFGISKKHSNLHADLVDENNQGVRSIG
jgi:hypothetical protein